MRSSSSLRIALALIALVSSVAAAPPPTDDDVVAYLRAHAMAPDRYIVDTFTKYEVVLLGEDHAVRQNLELVHRLIPELYAAGVTNLGMEFGASEDQQRLDALVTGDTYDPELARRIMFNYNNGWAYVEYMDVYRKAWELNRTLPKGAKKFRVLNISYKYDWTGYDGEKTPAAMKKVFYRGNTETYRADLIRREVLDRGEKVLVLTGTPHAFTTYRMPEYDYLGDGFVRLEDRHMGNLLWKLTPGRVFTVVLNQPFYGTPGAPGAQVAPAGGALDRAVAELGRGAVGFDLAGAAGALGDRSWYATGYPDFKLSDFAGGYVYLAPFDELVGCRVDEQFLTDKNWPEAYAQYPAREWRERPKTLEAYLQEIRDFVDLSKRYAGVRTGRR